MQQIWDIITIIQFTKANYSAIHGFYYYHSLKVKAPPFLPHCHLVNEGHAWVVEFFSLPFDQLGFKDVSFLSMRTEAWMKICYSVSPILNFCLLLMLYASSYFEGPFMRKGTAPAYDIQVYTSTKIYSLIFHFIESIVRTIRAIWTLNLHQ